MSYSPDVKIYLMTENHFIRLSDVMQETATLYETSQLDIKAGTRAYLYILVSGHQPTSNQICLIDGLKGNEGIFRFKYE
jgi:hypothetical protein